MSRLLKKTWPALFFVLVNFAIAATPAAAGWSADFCTDPDGNTEECCNWCLFFCDDCEIIL